MGSWQGEVGQSGCNPFQNAAHDNEVKTKSHAQRQRQREIKCHICCFSGSVSVEEKL